MFVLEIALARHLRARLCIIFLLLLFFLRYQNTTFAPGPISTEVHFLE